MAAPRTLTLRRVVAAAAAALAVAAGTISMPSPAFAATDSEAATAAATWLSGLLKDGKYLQREGFDPDTFEPIMVPDVGLTIDALLAFAAAGFEAPVDDIVGWLTGPGVIDQYVGNVAPVEEWDPPAGYHAGETAKVILALQVTGRSTTVDGVDLVAILRALELPSGDPNAGLFQNPDAAVFDDSNTFDQSLAILALARTPAGVPASAIDFLVSIECTTADGQKTFPIDYKTVPTGCHHTDATSMAVQALLAAGRTDLAAGPVQWLLGVQNANGGFWDTDPAASPMSQKVNSNSTGLSGQALHAYCLDPAADKAAAFIKTLQIGSDGPADQRGAIVYKPSNPDDIFDPGGFELSSATRATPQAVLALTDVALGGIAVDGVEAGLTQIQCPAAPTTAPPSTTTPATGGDELAATGTRAGAIAVTGGVMLAIGIVLVVGLAVRRRFAARAGRA